MVAHADFSQMHNNEGLPFKSFVPYLVANLEDSDGAVRESAKTAVVELFRFEILFALSP